MKAALLLLFACALVATASASSRHREADPLRNDRLHAVHQAVTGIRREVQRYAAQAQGGVSSTQVWQLEKARREADRLRMELDGTKRRQRAGELPFQVRQKILTRVADLKKKQQEEDQKRKRAQQTWKVWKTHRKMELQHEKTTKHKLKMKKQRRRMRQRQKRQEEEARQKQKRKVSQLRKKAAAARKKLRAINRRKKQQRRRREEKERTNKSSQHDKKLRRRESKHKKQINSVLKAQTKSTLESRKKADKRNARRQRHERSAKRNKRREARRRDRRRDEQAKEREEKRDHRSRLRAEHRERDHKEQARERQQQLHMDLELQHSLDEQIRHAQQLAEEDRKSFARRFDQIVGESNAKNTERERKHTTATFESGVKSLVTQKMEYKRESSGKRQRYQQMMASTKLSHKRLMEASFKRRGEHKRKMREGEKFRVHLRILEGRTKNDERGVKHREQLKAKREASKRRNKD